MLIPDEIYCEVNARSAPEGCFVRYIKKDFMTHGLDTSVVVRIIFGSQ